MRVFLDFEASSLGKHGTPIEVGWAFEDGRAEGHLIRPTSDWTDWSAEAEAIHGIARERLIADGRPHDQVAARMLDQLSGHDLFASAPSWDGKWLSALLRAAGFPRHALRLRDSEEAQRETAREILGGSVPIYRLDQVVEELIVRAGAHRQQQPARHRAQADAEEERARWQHVRDAALRYKDAALG